MSGPSNAEVAASPDGVEPMDADADGPAPSGAPAAAPAADALPPALDISNATTQQQMLEQQLAAVKKLHDIYSVEYFALLEELRAKHHEFVLKKDHTVWPDGNAPSHNRAATEAAQQVPGLSGIREYLMLVQQRQQQLAAAAAQAAPSNAAASPAPAAAAPSSQAPEQQPASSSAAAGAPAAPGPQQAAGELPNTPTAAAPNAAAGATTASNAAATGAKNAGPAQPNLTLPSQSSESMHGPSGSAASDSHAPAVSFNSWAAANAAAAKPATSTPQSRSTKPPGLPKPQLSAIRESPSGTTPERTADGPYAATHAETEAVAVAAGAGVASTGRSSSAPPAQSASAAETSAGPPPAAPPLPPLQRPAPPQPHDATWPYGDAVLGYGVGAAPLPAFRPAEDAVLQLQGDCLVPPAEQLAAWRQRFADAAPKVMQLEYLASAGVVQQMEAMEALACLCSKLGVYYLRRPVVVFGRSTDTKGDVDIDLSQEGASQKVSRRQGCISLQPDGAFRLCNTGRREVHVNGALLQQFETVQLPHLSVIEAGGVTLLFMVNPVAVSRVQQRTLKMVM